MKNNAKLLAGLWLMVCAAFFVLFQGAPLLWVAAHSFVVGAHWSLGHYRAVFAMPLYRQALAQSLEISGWSSLIGIAVAALGSYSLSRIDTRLRECVMAFAALTNYFCGVPLALAMVALLGFDGYLTLALQHWDLMRSFNLYAQPGLVLLYAYFQVPLGILLLYPAFDALRAGRAAGAAPPVLATGLATGLTTGPTTGPTTTLTTALALTPALLGTFMVLLANALGTYAAIYALTHGGYNIVPIRMASLVTGGVAPGPNAAGVLTVLLAGLVWFVILVHRWLLSVDHHEAR